jgi:hypothetical protein
MLYEHASPVPSAPRLQAIEANTRTAPRRFNFDEHAGRQRGNDRLDGEQAGMTLPNPLRERPGLGALALCIALSVVGIAPHVEAKPRGRPRAQSYYYAGRSGPARTWLKLTRIGNKLQGRAVRIMDVESESQSSESRRLTLVTMNQPGKIGWMMEDEDGSTFSLEFQSDQPGKPRVGTIGDARLILKHNDSGDTVSMMRTGAAEFDKALRLHGELENRNENDDPNTFAAAAPAPSQPRQQIVTPVKWEEVAPVA